VRDSHLRQHLVVSASPPSRRRRNAIAQGYIDFTLSGGGTSRSSPRLLHQPAGGPAGRDHAEGHRASEVRGEKGIITGTGDLNELTQEPRRLRQKMTEAQADASAARARCSPWSGRRRRRSRRSGPTIRSAALQHRGGAGAKYREQLTTYGPNLPQVRQLKEALDSPASSSRARPALAQKAIAGARADYGAGPAGTHRPGGAAAGVGVAGDPAQGGLRRVPGAEGPARPGAPDLQRLPEQADRRQDVGPDARRRGEGAERPRHRPGAAPRQVYKRRSSSTRCSGCSSACSSASRSPS